MSTECNGRRIRKNKDFLSSNERQTKLYEMLKSFLFALLGRYKTAHFFTKVYDLMASRNALVAKTSAVANQRGYM